LKYFDFSFYFEKEGTPNLIKTKSLNCIIAFDSFRNVKRNKRLESILRAKDNDWKRHQIAFVPRNRHSCFVAQKLGNLAPTQPSKTSNAKSES